MILKFQLRLFRMEQVVGIDTMYDIHVMTGIPQRVAESVDIDCVAAETMRRVKCGQVQKVEGTVHITALATRSMNTGETGEIRLIDSRLRIFDMNVTP